MRIPKNLSSVSDLNPFDDSQSFEYFDAPPDCVGFKTLDGVLFNKNMTKLIQFPQNKKITKYIVPSEVEIIGDGSFHYSKYVNKFVLPESLKIISPYGFSYMGPNLKSIIVLRNNFSPKLEINNIAFLNTEFQPTDIQYMNITQYLELECKLPTPCQNNLYFKGYNVLFIAVFIYL